MASIVRAHSHSATIPIGDLDSVNRGVLDRPQYSDFVAPFFYFASKCDSEITAASPSIEAVLGICPQEILGTRFSSLYCPGCVLNADEPAVRLHDLAPGDSIQMLRSVCHQSGTQRILSIQSSAVAKSGDSQSLRHHHVAEDVTERVRSYVHARARLQEIQSVTGQLSIQERRVAESIRHGMMNRQIAEELQISERTVDRRRATILKQLGVDTTAEMVTVLVEQEIFQQWVDSAVGTGWSNARNIHLASQAVQRMSA